MKYPKMTFVERLRETALHLCMDSGMRYMEALHITVWFASRNWYSFGAPSSNELSEFLNFEKSFRQEYADYDKKMRAAGMK